MQFLIWGQQNHVLLQTVKKRLVVSIVLEWNLKCLAAENVLHLTRYFNRLARSHENRLTDLGIPTQINWYPSVSGLDFQGAYGRLRHKDWISPLILVIWQNVDGLSTSLRPECSWRQLLGSNQMGLCKLLQGNLIVQVAVLTLTGLWLMLGSERYVEQGWQRDDLRV